MKKLLSVLFLLVSLLPASSLAECDCCRCAPCTCATSQEAILIACSECSVQSGAYAGEAWFALSSGNRIIGKTGPFEDHPVLPACPPALAYIGGCADNGVIREKGSMALLYDVTGMPYGLKSVHVSVTVSQEYVSFVESIVRDRLDTNAVTANSIIASTMWWSENTVCHIFFLPSSPRIHVGTVTVNKCKSSIALYAGDFNGDGIPELGFTAGSCPTPEPTPEPTPDPAPEKKPECSGQKTCVKNYYTTNIIQINNQVNINSKVTNVQKVSVPCRKGVQCVTLGK
jgi:hypothetical protein